MTVSPVIAEELVFNQLTGDVNIVYNDSIIEQEDGYLIKVESEEEYNECRLDTGYSVLSWRHISKIVETDLFFHRLEEKIFAEGVLDGKKFSKTYKINDEPWYQFHELNMTEFGLSANELRYFWTIDRRKMDIVRFKAEKIGEEMITAGGSTWNSVKVELSLTGLAGVLGWHSWFWLRISDGRYLKLDAPGFLPSDEDSSVELVNELTR